jgi:hypothetical protein
MPHQGRHPNAYHDYMLENISEFDNVAQGSTEVFLDLFSDLKAEIISNPDMLRKAFLEVSSY